jgi:CelD/BcsL family acetyltransferase involved in cellulose biosynthesis
VAEPAIEPVARLEDVRADWTRLALATGHPFATWEWSSVWWRHFGAERDLYTFLCRDEQGEVAAILPMYVALRGPFPLARFLGYADLQSPVCGPQHRELAAAGLRAAIRRPHRCRVLFAERMPGEAGWGERLGGALVHSDDLPLLRIEGRSWDELLATLNRKHRSTVRRKERRLLERGLVFRLADDPDRLEDDMRSLFRLHQARWGSDSTGVFAGPGAEFHLELAAAALAAGWLRLWIAELDGEPAAIWYGFRYAGVQWHYQGGRDPRFDSLSVGGALWMHTIRDACEDGLDAYHFLAGTEAYKMHFATENETGESRMVGPRPLTAVVSGALRARRRIAQGALPRMRRRRDAPSP